MTHSTRHSANYQSMAKEMLQYAGFQESVNVTLRQIAQYGAFSYDYQRWCDDLYDIYGNAQVTE